MGYMEYFNYGNCSVCSTYTNYSNSCSVYYFNQQTYKVYRNYGNYINLCQTYKRYYLRCSIIGSGCSHTEYTNYVNYTNYTNYQNYADTCSTYYLNLNNQGVDYQEYVNHRNYSNPNSGAPMSLSWNGSNWNNYYDKPISTYITGSIPALKELRDKIAWVSTHKGQQNAGVDTSINSSNVGDAVFNDNDSGTAEFIEDNYFDQLRISLLNLANSMNITLTGMDDVSVGDKVNEDRLKEMKRNAERIAEADIRTSYSNAFSAGNAYKNAQ